MRQEEPLCLADSDDSLGNEDEDEEDDASYKEDHGDEIRKKKTSWMKTLKQ